MGVHKLTTEAMTYEGSRCGRGRPPEQRPGRVESRSHAADSALAWRLSSSCRAEGDVAHALGHHQRPSKPGFRVVLHLSPGHRMQQGHLQRLGQPAEPGRISSECEILGSDAGSDCWQTKPRVSCQPARVRIGQAGSQPRPSHRRPLNRSSAASTLASSANRSWRLISSAFKQAHCSLSRAQLSPSAQPSTGFSSLAGRAELSPAGAVRPAGGFFSSGISSSRMFVEPSGRLARASESPIAVRVGCVGRFTKPERLTNAMGVAMSMERSLVPHQWKPEEISGNQMVSQRDIGGVCIAPKPHELPTSVVSKMAFAGALNECLRHDGRSDEVIAKEIHISKGYMSKLLRAVWAAQVKRLVLFMRETNCIAPLQWIAHQVGCDVVVRSAQQARIARLEAELAEARRA